MSDKELIEHAERVEEMKAAEKRVRDCLRRLDNYPPDPADVRLLLERIDEYEASITWYTNCLNCPKLYDKNHEYHELLRAVVGAGENGGFMLQRGTLIDAIKEALK